MSLVNYSTREITCKIVYYGPGRSGKTSNLQYIHAFVPEERKGPMVSLATETDRTLFFDFLPLDLGTISGFRTRMQLYTVPGQVYYNATRKLVLRGADGVVFVADSQPEQYEENIESLRNLHENLLEENIELRDFPMVIQYNKRDLPGVMPIAELDDLLNFRGAPAFPAAAVSGDGVFDTLKAVSQLVLQSLSRRFGQEIQAPVSESAPADTQ
jgi:signal recognition particle receptor subunit beta